MNTKTSLTRLSIKSERTLGRTNSSTTALDQFSMSPLAKAVALALMALMMTPARAQSNSPLPSGASVVQGAKPPVINQQTMRIDQVAPRAIINWNSFNIGAGHRVEFNQQGRSDWAILNRVTGTERSVINGVLQADGQVFLLNNNGILIGKGAQINVHTFLASTLTMTDKLFTDGILSLGAQSPVLTAGAGDFAPKGNIRIEPDAIVVAKDGGRLSFIASGQIFDTAGQLMLDGAGKPVAGVVENEGKLVTSNGQIILAAGDRVFFRQASTAVSDREKGFTGLVVEVDSGGRVANAVLGVIESRLGNVSMVGMTVNQDGRVSATTSVNRNGSIWLMARDNATNVNVSGNLFVAPTRGGKLSLGSPSVTEILPDAQTAATTSIDASDFTPSQVRLEGQTIHLQGSPSQGARVTAPGGDVFVVARSDPQVKPLSITDSLNNHTPDGSAVVLDRNTRIDVSGLRGRLDERGNALETTGVPVPIERNSIRIELRGEQLADAPLLRDSPIRSQAINVDARLGTTLINQESLNNAVASQTQRDVFERMTKGGTVDISSTGAVVTQPGSWVSLEGGSIAYSAGTVTVSRLFDGRNYYPIATAPNDRPYISISNALKLPEGGYLEGGAAGNLKIATGNLSFQGKATGGSVVGQNQRAKAPYRGSLTLNSMNPLSIIDSSGNTLPDYLNTTANWVDSLDNQFGITAAPKTQTLSAEMLRDSKLQSLSVTTTNSLKLSPGAKIELTPGTDLKLSSIGPVSIERGIRSASGRLTLGGTGDVTVADNISLDVSGQWINDSGAEQAKSRGEVDSAGATRNLTDGGKVLLTNTKIGSNTTVDTSAGARIDTNGQISGGKGGEFAVSFALPPGSTGNSREVSLPTNLLGHGFTAGSSLSLTGDYLWLGPNAPSGTQTLPISQFAASGFSTLNLNFSKITLASGYNLTPSLQQYELPQRTTQATGAALRARARSVVLDPSRAATMALNFSAKDFLGTGSISVQPGASINAPVGSSVKLDAQLSIGLEGSISAKAGDVTMTTNSALELALGYRSDAGIRIGASGSIDVSGLAISRIGTSSAKLGEVRNGGNISLNASGASGTIQVEEGAELSIEGKAAIFDVPYRDGASIRYATQTVASDAGSLSLSASQGGLFAGTVLANAGAQNRAYGRISFRYLTSEAKNDRDDYRILTDSQLSELSPNLFPLAERQFLLSAAQSLRPLGYSLRADWDVLVNGARPVSDLNDAKSQDAFGKRISQWRISADSLRDAGSLSLLDGEVLRFSGVSTLSARETLVVGSYALRAELGQTIDLSAPYVRLGFQGGLITASSDTSPSFPNSYFSARPLAPFSGSGGGQINVGASLGMDLESKFIVQGASKINLSTPGSIRLIGRQQDSASGLSAGSLKASGDINLIASSVFPVSLSLFEINAPNGDINVSRSSLNPLPGSTDTPYSAYGQVRLSARNILQSGNLYAPFGRIAFNASNSLRFAGDSLTSVSGSGIELPFGNISNGTNWVLSPDASNVHLQNPDKAIIVSAQTVVTEASGDGKAAARIDLSGGGNIVASEFIKGPQGSTDLYAAPGSFAVLPAYKAPFAPVIAGQTSPIASAATIRFERDVPGLPAGLYVILPAAYAQVNGAFLVRPVSTSTLGTPLSGTDVVMSGIGIPAVVGFRARENQQVNTQKAEWFEVLNAAQVKSLAEYKNTSASTFFAQESGSRVQDGGTLQLAMDRALDLAGQVTMRPDIDKPTGLTGRAGTLEIAGDKIQVLASTTQGTSVPGTIQVSQAKLQEIAPGNLHLGATVTGNQVTTRASSVEIAPDVSIKSGTFIVSANDQLTIGARAAIEVSSQAGTATNTENRVLNVVRAAASGDSSGATLVLSTQPSQVLRAGTVNTGNPSLSVAEQVRLVGDSVSVSSTGSLSIDTTAQVQGKNGTNLASQSIILGNAPSNVSGFRLAGPLLDGLNRSGSTSIQAYRQITAYGDQALGSDQTNFLGIDTPSLVAGSSGSALALTGRSVLLTNTSSQPLPTLSSNLSGSKLVINVTGSAANDGLRIGQGNKNIDRFETVTLNVGAAAPASKLNFEGQSALNIGGNLVANVDNLTSSKLADANVKVNGSTVFARRTAQASTPSNVGAGGRLSIDAASVSFDSGLLMPSGEVSLRANSGALSLGSQAVLNVAGLQSPIFDQRIELSGGTVRLTNAGSGNALTIANGAVIDVSAGANRGGNIELRTEGSLALGSTAALKAQALEKSQGGSLLIDAQRGVDLDQVARVSVSGGFDRSVDVRARSGDLRLSVGSVLKSETVVVAADNGRMDIEGTVDASSAAGGSVALWQRGSTGQALTLRNGASINVAGETGGEVTIGSSNSIQVSGRSQITAGSTDNRREGRITFRAPRTGPGASGTGIALTRAASGDTVQIQGRASTYLEGVRTNLSFATTLAANTPGAAITTDANAYRANSAAISQAAPISTQGPLQVLAGVEITGAANANLVTNSNNLDFAALGTGLGALTLRSNGNLTIAGSISDGMNGAATLARDSWSYRFVAGADLGAANPLAVVANRNADTTPSASRVGGLTIAANKDVRTGTGTIHLSASDQIVFGPTPGPSLIVPPGSEIATNPGSVYTVGRIANAADGYVNDPGYFSGQQVARTQGGSVTVQAGGQVIGNDMGSSPAAWLSRQGTLNAAGEYSTVAGWLPSVGALPAILPTGQRLSSTVPNPPPVPTGASGFNMHLGSLAGGKLTVNARSTENLYLANVSSGRMRSTVPNEQSLEIINRAPTVVNVERDISGGQFLSMDGALSLSAGQNIGAATNGAIPIPFQGNNQINLRARTGIDVARPYNPTLLASTRPTFSTFGDNALLNVSTVGDVKVRAPSVAVRALTAGNSAQAAFAALSTPNWQVQSASNIYSGGGVILAPSNNRRFSLLASENVWSNPSGELLISSNGDPNLISHLRPISTNDLLSQVSRITTLLARPLPDDPKRAPIRIYAGQGDVAPAPEATKENAKIAFSFGQPVQIKAGRDVRQLDLVAQNNLDSDETSVQAGRDITNQVLGISNSTKFEISGPGTATLVAGRNIDLGNTDSAFVGISSVGNAKVGDLPVKGAALVLIAGVKERPAYDEILNTYLKPGSNGQSFDQSRYLGLARQTLSDAGKSASANATGDEIWTAVQGLSRSQQDQLARNIFFQELRIAGGPDTRSLIRDFIAPVAGGTTPKRFGDSLVAFLLSKGLENVDASNAWTQFDALPSVQQAEFVSTTALPVLLADRSLASNDPRVRNYARGYEVAAKLFPQDGAGNIDLAYNVVRSNQGGAIQFLAPGNICRDVDPATCFTAGGSYKANPEVGNIRVGLTNPPKDSEKLGVFGLAGAAVGAYTGNNIDVNQSRIVAAGGGDIVLWSSGGSIDAGRGSKAAISAPPPTVTVDSSGNVKVELSSAIQGSGIRSVSFSDKAPAGEVSLYAPKGTIDAGDAGIQGGSVNVGAARILNAENIRLSSDPTGANVTFGGANIAVSVSPAASSSAATAAASQAQSSAAGRASNRTRIIVIDFEGFGADCKETPNDPICKPN